MVEVSNEYVELASDFNDSCTGSESTSTEVYVGQPMSGGGVVSDIQEALEAAVIESLSAPEDITPNFSTLQSDLSLLNVDHESECMSAQAVLESHFDVYGIKGWIPRSGASAYALVRQSNDAPYVIFMRSTFSY